MSKWHHLTDDMLVAAYQDGCDDAFDELLYRYKDKLFSYIFYTVRNKNLAEDLFQEVFCKVITTLRDKRYTAKDRFYPWLLTITHNMIMDQFEREAQMTVISNDAVDIDLFGGTEDCGTAADREREAAERLDDICRLIDCLSEEQRQILRWRIFENIPFKEIAEREHISINTALGRMRYALLNMRRLAVERDLQPYVC